MMDVKTLENHLAKGRIVYSEMCIIQSCRVFGSRIFTWDKPPDINKELEEIRWYNHMKNI